MGMPTPMTIPSMVFTPPPPPPPQLGAQREAEQALANAMERYSSKCTLQANSNSSFLTTESDRPEYDIYRSSSSCSLLESSSFLMQAAKVNPNAAYREDARFLSSHEVRRELDNRFPDGT